MANYTNQVPADLRVNDVLTFDKGGNYVLPRGQFKAEVASAKGGEGGSGKAAASLYGYTTPGSSIVHYGISTSGGGVGGAGGNGIAAIFELALSEPQNALKVLAGYVGVKGTDKIVDWHVSGSATGGIGGTGAEATLTVNGKLLARTTGGSGGTGGYVTASAGGAVPSRDGQTVSRSVSGGNGKTGASGTIALAPAGYTTTPNAGQGYVRLTVLSLNAPPSKPEPISYSTPLSGREQELSCAVSIDPDPGDTVKYIWEEKTDLSVWKQIAVTSTNKAVVIAPSAGSNVTYRVKAEDNHGAQSDYATGSPKTIIYNYPPTISGTDEDRGGIRDPFVYLYSVDDRDAGDVLTVDVFLDDASHLLDHIDNAVRNKEYGVDFGALWESVSMGKHALFIRAKDDKGGEAQRKIAFTRHSNKLEVELAEPIKLSELVTTLIPMINYTAGMDYTAQIRVKNDPTAAWEDVTVFNHAGQIYEFVNQNKTTAGDSEFTCQVTIEKGPSAHSIEFRGGTFIVNANGIEMSYAKGIRINPADVIGGVISGAINVMEALNLLSLAYSPTGIKILDAYDSEAQLRAAHPTGTQGDAYSVFNSAMDRRDLYIWSKDKSNWINVGPISGVAGQRGEDGNDGKDGRDGRNADFGAYFDTLAELTAARPADDGKLYLVGADLVVHYWDADANAWTPAASLVGRKGDQGERGSQWHNVSTPPGEIPGSRIGDWAVNTGDAGFTLFEKTGDDTWQPRGELRGPRGEHGKNFAVLGLYPTLEALKTAVPSPAQGDTYQVGLSAPYTAYMWIDPDWVDQGTIQGKSAYEIWRDEGNAGSEADFLAALKGEPGQDGASTADAVSVDTSQYPAGGALTTEANVMAALATLAKSSGGGDTLEVGNNANGTYYKFSSGLLICVKYNHECTGVYETWFYPHEFNRNAGLPFDFGVSMIPFWNNSIVGELRVNSTGNNSFLGFNTNASSQSIFYANIIVIGRWR